TSAADGTPATCGANRAGSSAAVRTISSWPSPSRSPIENAVAGAASMSAMRCSGVSAGECELPHDPSIARQPVNSQMRILLVMASTALETLVAAASTAPAASPAPIDILDLLGLSAPTMTEQGSHASSEL